MIKYLQIENFKSLHRVALSLRNLNVLVGLNGMGKSSVMQSLLLLRQSYWRVREQRLMRVLNLNDELVALGQAGEILCQTADESFIKFYISCMNGEEFSVKSEPIDNEIKMLSNDILLDKPLELSDVSEPLFQASSCMYLGAERIVPRKDYSSQAWSSLKANIFGSTGKYVVPYLAMDEDRYNVPDALCHPGEKSNKLLDQVTAWMQEISPNIRIRARMIDNESKSKFWQEYFNGNFPIKNVSPPNGGFGITYVLPLITELLLSGDNTLLLLENPESHLHPKGQAAMGNLIARAAGNGAQVICETHSDHVINGIRVGIKKRVLSNEAVTLSYFSKNEKEETKLENVELDERGGLRKYPPGLLDQWGILMRELL